MIVKRLDTFVAHLRGILLCNDQDLMKKAMLTLNGFATVNLTGAKKGLELTKCKDRIGRFHVREAKKDWRFSLTNAKKG